MLNLDFGWFNRSTVQPFKDLTENISLHNEVYNHDIDFTFGCLCG